MCAVGAFADEIVYACFQCISAAGFVPAACDHNDINVVLTEGFPDRCRQVQARYVAQNHSAQQNLGARVFKGFQCRLTVTCRNCLVSDPFDHLTKIAALDRMILRYNNLPFFRTLGHHFSSDG